jgi:hypothetical protein
LDVVKKIFALHIFNHYKVVVTVLENVEKFDYVWVLAHLQHFDLPPLLDHLYWFHVYFFYYFDGHALPGPFVQRKLHQAELAFAQCCANFVVVEDVIVAHSLLETFIPQLKRFLIFEVNYARLVWRQHYFYWVVNFALS